MTQLTVIQPASIQQAVPSTNFLKNKRFFSLRPAQVELIQPTTRMEGATPGKFRVLDTGEEFESMRVVMLVDPAEARTMFEKGSDFGSSPVCYSMDAIRPSDKAASPQALSCASCRNSDWSTWKKTKKQEDLPPCHNRFIMYLVERETQIPYKLAVRGKSITPFLTQCQHIARLAQLYLAREKKEPMLHFFSFTIKSMRKVNAAGVSYVMQFEDTKVMDDAAKGEFGALVAEFEALRSREATEVEADEANDNLDAELSEETTTTKSAQTIDASTEFNTDEVEQEAVAI